jgi:signal transduction histidine kinase
LSQVLKKRVILADRAKGIFISNISHELRSPLHGILASAEFLLDTRLDVLQRTFIDTVNSCGRTLLEVINHVLDFGKLMYVARLENATRPQFQRSTSNTSSAADTVGQRQSDSPADLAVIIEEVVEACYAGYEYKEFFGQVDIVSLLEPQLKRTDSRHGMVQDFGRKDASGGLTVVIDVDQRSDGWAFALQSGAVQRIVMNLTGNALKYTSSGWVRIHLSGKEVEGRTTVQVTVSDSGKGISPEFLRSRLFSPFSQEDTLQAGTGLGMSIVKQVVQRLGGNISVSSQLGIGTQVRVTLPGQAITDKTELEDNVSRLSTRTKGMKVFLTGFDTHVTAGRLTYESIERYLTDWYDMEVVDDLSSSDLIISDDCPELHNYFQQSHNASSLKFNSSSESVCDTDPIPYQASQPLIVLCSNALRYEYFGQQSSSGRIINFVSKPCGPHKLATGIAYCLEQLDLRDNQLESGETSLKNSSNTDTAHQTVATSDDSAIRFQSSGARPQDDLSQQQLTPHSPSILIVEDNAVNSLILATFLRKKGYSFEQAENGLIALQTVEANPKGFDVILMDIQSTPTVKLTNLSAGDGWLSGNSSHT